tara:strand:+ start:34 stop:312 length:279 start_codon:yes stop_codon:yes gene_type:complete
MTTYAQIRDDEVFIVVDTSTGYPDPTVNQIVGTTWVKCAKTIKQGDLYDSSTKKFTKIAPKEIVDGKVAGEDLPLGEDVKIQGEGYRIPLDE